MFCDGMGGSLGGGELKLWSSNRYVLVVPFMASGGGFLSQSITPHLVVLPWFCQILWPMCGKNDLHTIAATSVQHYWPTLFQIQWWILYQLSFVLCWGHCSQYSPDCHMIVAIVLALYDFTATLFCCSFELIFWSLFPPPSFSLLLTLPPSLSEYPSQYFTCYVYTHTHSLLSRYLWCVSDWLSCSGHFKLDPNFYHFDNHKCSRDTHLPCIR